MAASNIKPHGHDLIQERKRKERLYAIVAYFILSVFAIFFVLPLLFSIATSLKYPQDVFNIDVKNFLKNFIPSPMIDPWWFNFFGRKSMNLANMTYDGAFFAGWDGKGIPPFGRYYINSIFVSVAVTLLQLVTSTLAAYAFARLTWPGRDKVFLAYLGTMMVPGQVTMIPVFILFKNLGLVDTYLALILPAAFTAYGTFLLRQYFMTIPAELEEAAFIDGASRMQILLQVIVPLSNTALATLAINTFLYTWNDFMWPMIIINSDPLKTLPVGLQAFQTSYGAQWHLIMAASLIVLVPVILVYIFGQKYITKGIVMTGLK